MKRKDYRILQKSRKDQNARMKDEAFLRLRETLAKAELHTGNWHCGELRKEIGKRLKRNSQSVYTVMGYKSYAKHSVAAINAVTEALQEIINEQTTI